VVRQFPHQLRRQQWDDGDLGIDHKRPSAFLANHGSWDPVANRWIVLPLDDRYKDVDGSIHCVWPKKRRDVIVKSAFCDAVPSCICQITLGRLDPKVASFKFRATEGWFLLRYLYCQPRHTLPIDLSRVWTHTDTVSWLMSRQLAGRRHQRRRRAGGACSPAAPP
jgi:hypothetical protein